MPYINIWIVLASISTDLMFQTPMFSDLLPHRYMKNRINHGLQLEKPTCINIPRSNSSS